jgi:hypothetical protein
MKANEAPEKIILSADRETGILYDEWVIRDLTDNIKIEYTRTDAFIEKAVVWISNNCYIPHSTLEDFKNYMKGE